MTKLPDTIHLKGLRNVTASYQPKVWLNDKFLKPDKSLKIRAHSFNGFNWGYETRGAAQLALAVCLEIYPTELALEVYHQFKEQFLLSIHDDNFILTLDLKEFNQANIRAFEV